MPLFSSPKPFKGQNYDALKKTCKDSGQLFVDPIFPPKAKSIYPKKSLPEKIEWKRPKELASDPRLFVEGASSGDVSQGQLGNCWFVSSCSSLAQEKELWGKVIPNSKDQEWDSENPEEYQGIFHFRFWRFGEWIDVVIDDFLPTAYGKLIFVHSQTRNEFWSALLEKAYAKLSGSYEALDGGNTADALVDFSGGVAEPINLEKEKFYEDPDRLEQLYKMMDKCMDRHSLISASIKVTSAEEMEAKTESGLIKGHAYGVTDIRNISLSGSGLSSFFKKEKIHMIRLRNPWGAKEWNGPWSDGSPEWKKVSKSQKEKLGITVADDGEFWMTFEDFTKYFTNCVICRLPNTAYLSLARTWHEYRLFSRWKKNASPTLNRAGGCINNKETFLQNPQFIFSIDDDKDDIMISISQTDKKLEDKDNLTIGFYIMKVEENRKYRVHTLMPKETVSTYINSRSVFERLQMKRGRYVVMPTTFDPNEEDNLMIRVFADDPTEVKELVKDKPERGCLTGICGYPQCVSSLKISGATGLQRKDRLGAGADPYVYIICERQKIRSEPKKGTLNPQWDLNVLLYRKKPEKPITIQIWNSNLVKDDFMGQTILIAQPDGQTKTLNNSLTDKGSKMDEKKPGTINLQLTTYRDLMAV